MKKKESSVVSVDFNKVKDNYTLVDTKYIISSKKAQLAIIDKEYAFKYAVPSNKCASLDNNTVTKEFTYLIDIRGDLAKYLDSSIFIRIVSDNNYCLSYGDLVRVTTDDNGTCVDMLINDTFPANNIKEETKCYEELTFMPAAVKMEIMVHKQFSNRMKINYVPIYLGGDEIKPEDTKDLINNVFPSKYDNISVPMSLVTFIMTTGELVYGITSKQINKDMEIDNTNIFVSNISEPKGTYLDAFRLMDSVVFPIPLKYFIDCKKLLNK